MRLLLPSWLLVFIHTFILTIPGFCQVETPPAACVANYRIEVKLDTLGKKLQGYETITFVNTSAKPADTLFLHLYPNAFQSDSTIFMKESLLPERFRRGKEYKGSINIKQVEIGSGFDLTGCWIIDETIMKLPLSQPLSPAESVKIKIDFTVNLPQIFMRMGYSGKDYMIGQWFPKMAVLQNDGKWNAHQYHFNSEFFADFGKYDVDITVPANYLIGATGYLTEKRGNQDSTVTFVFQAEDVHDFVWVASPDYLISKRTVDGIEIDFLYKPEHAKAASRILDAAEFALRYYDSSFGKYPYRKFTIADIRIGWGGGAMEYPMLVTCVPSDFPPDIIRLDAMVLFHEIAHQWWYGVVASNEFEEAWLDEGFATYSESKAMEEKFGTKANLVDLWGININDENINKLTYLLDPQSDPPVKNSWEFMDYLSYRANVYSKASLLLQTMGNYMGKEKMDELLKGYFQRYRFKHPRTRDFTLLVLEMTGEDFDPVFEQVLFGTGLCDYEVASIRSEPVKSDSTQGGFQTEVLLKRLGEVVIPVDISMEFASGEKIKQTWDGKERWHRIEMETDSKIKSAIIDPDDKIALEVNINNNSLTTEAEDSAVLKLFTQCFFGLETFVHCITSF